MSKYEKYGRNWSKYGRKYGNYGKYGKYGKYMASGLPAKVSLGATSQKQNH